MANIVSYDPNNSIQTSFLSALALGETGGSSNAAMEGFGGVDLSSAPHDNFGFPVQPAGSNVSSAAGTYQFLKGTWDQVAGSLGINDFSPGSQNEAAWTYAQQVYAQKTGGSLYDDLQAGKYMDVQSALGSIWPSVYGNGAAPQGLAHSLEAGLGAPVPFPPLTEERRQALRRLAVHKGSSVISRTGSSVSG